MQDTMTTGDESKIGSSTAANRIEAVVETAIDVDDPDAAGASQRDVPGSSFHSMVASLLPETSVRPSGAKASERTLPASPRRMARTRGLATSHSRTSPAEPRKSVLPRPTAIVPPSGEKATL